MVQFGSGSAEKDKRKTESERAAQTSASKATSRTTSPYFVVNPPAPLCPNRGWWGELEVRQAACTGMCRNYRSYTRRLEKQPSVPLQYPHTTNPTLDYCLRVYTEEGQTKDTLETKPRPLSQPSISSRWITNNTSACRLTQESGSDYGLFEHILPGDQGRQPWNRSPLRPRPRSEQGGVRPTLWQLSLPSSHGSCGRAEQRGNKDTREES